MTMQDDVRRFHLATGNPAPERPTKDVRWQLRQDLHREEYNELWDAVWHRPRGEPVLANVAQETADLIFVLLGTMVEAGIDFEPIWRAVVDANMAKVGGPVRADGKLLKPEGWTPPDIAAIIDGQR